jgi:carboxyl-terminal processing protease
MFKKRFIPLYIIIIVFSCFKKSEGLKQTDMQFLVNQVLAVHAQINILDDNISKRIFNNYIDSLDYGKYYFYQSDIKQFSKNELLFDDFIAANDYRAVFEIFKVYKERTDQMMKMFDDLINENYDFSKDESILVDRNKIQYSSSEADMKDRWRKNIKLQLLNYTSSGKTVKEGKQKLKKKYQLMKKRIDEIDEERLLSMFMNSITTALDPHTNYLSYEEHQDFKISMELKLEGIGVRLRSEDGFVMVESIIAGGAADKLPETMKLKPNDKIVAVAQKNGDFVDVIDMELRDVVKLIRGKKGTEVKLAIIRETGKSGKTSRLNITIVREEIALQDSEAKSQIETIKRENGKTCKIGYIRLPSFYEDPGSGKSSSGDVKHLLEDLSKQKVNIVILDLRGNPGGLLTEAVDIAGLFIEQGPVLQLVRKNAPPKVYYDNDPEMYYTGPLIVLIDTFSASASEILAGAIKDYKRGLIVGSSNTYGKGTVQAYNVLQNNLGAIKITTHIFYQPGGTSNQLNGIAPDIIIPDFSSIWEISENEHKYPLKWDKIESSGFQKYRYINDPMIKKLYQNSQTRTGKGEYIELKKKIADYRAKLKNKMISLKEESEINKQKEKEIEEKIKHDREKDKVDIKNDLFLREAFNIGFDYYENIGK